MLCAVRRRHTVLTGVALARADGCGLRCRTTDVKFREISPDEALAYWHSGEPCDKAGAYAIQGCGGVFVERLAAAIPALSDCRYYETVSCCKRRASRSVDSGQLTMTDESLKEEILINVTPSEVRAALLENGVLQEVYIERSARRGLISNIYKGRVSAGAARACRRRSSISAWNGRHFCTPRISHKPQRETRTTMTRPEYSRAGSRRRRDPGAGRQGPARQQRRTADHLHYFAVRHLVLLPRSDGVGISARIEDEDERERLRAHGRGTSGRDGISPVAPSCRTVAEGADRDALGLIWVFAQAVGRRSGTVQQARVKTLVHEDLSLPLRVLRDMVTSDVERILVDSESDFRRCRNLPTTFPPEIDADAGAVPAAPADLRSARHRRRDSAAPWIEVFL